MDKTKRTRSILAFAALIVLISVGIILTRGSGAESGESIKEVMRDAVLHDLNHVNFFGIEVNPGLISGFIVSGILIVLAVILRIFVVPKFKLVPGRLQMLIEQAVGLFSGMAESNSRHRNGFLGAYIFAAGAYIFVGTLFELLGVQAVCTNGNSISLPAPLSDINGAIMMGCLSYLVIFSGAIAGNGLKGIKSALQEFSLPLSMSFRLFGALLSGALVTELVYYYSSLSYVLPVVVGVLFTLLHALIQAYVLTMLTSLFYGEKSEKLPQKQRKSKINSGKILKPTMEVSYEGRE